jgi:hypothetical protein
MVSGLVGTPTASAITLNFTKINVDYEALPHAPCMTGVDACLIEEDGTYPPAPQRHARAAPDAGVSVRVGLPGGAFIA